MLTVDLDQENTPNFQVLYFFVSQTLWLRESGFQTHRLVGKYACQDAWIMRLCALYYFNKMKWVLSLSLSSKLSVHVCGETASVAGLATESAQVGQFCINLSLSCARRA